MTNSSHHAAAWPHIVAHRGASGIAPENTFTAFERALALGVQEIEFDLWATSDGRVVVCHDASVDRTTPAKGQIHEMTCADIQALDAGTWFGEEWGGGRIPTLEETFELLAGKAHMNIHIKEPGPDGLIINRVRDMAASAGISDAIYITGHGNVLECARANAPELACCCLEGQEKGRLQIERAMELGCERIQFSVGCCTDDDIGRARELGLIVNYFFCDEVDEAKRLLDIGVMALLTNHPERIALDDLK
jgi:glycerophosphoryl diester phosphodiesterase